MQLEPMFHVEPVRRWWVFYGEAQGLGWVRWFVPKQWSHAFALTTVASNVPIVVNPSRRALEIALPLGTTAEAIRYFRELGFRCQVVEVADPFYNLPKHFMVKTCASIVAHALGVDTWAMTPRGLWRALERIGAREVG